MENSFEFLQTFLKFDEKYLNLRLIEINYDFSELSSLIDLFEMKRIKIINLYPNLSRIILINDKSKFKTKLHSPHFFNSKSLDIDILEAKDSNGYNLYQIDFNGNYKLEVDGKFYNVSSNNQNIKLFGTNLYPSIEDYIELDIDTLFEIKPDWYFNYIESNEKHCENTIKWKIPIANINEFSVTVINPDFNYEGENISNTLTLIKKLNVKARLSLKIKTVLTSTPFIKISSLSYLKITLSSTWKLYDLLDSNICRTLTKLHIISTGKANHIYSEFKNWKLIDTLTLRITENNDELRDANAILFCSCFQGLETVDIQFDITKMPQDPELVEEIWMELLARQKRLKYIKYISINRPEGEIFKYKNILN